MCAFILDLCICYRDRHFCLYKIAKSTSNQVMTVQVGDGTLSDSENLDKSQVSLVYYKILFCICTLDLKCQ